MAEDVCTCFSGSNRAFERLNIIPMFLPDTRRFLYALLLLAWQSGIFLCSGIPPDLETDEHPIQCERMNVPFCHGIGYNVTIRMGDGHVNPFTKKESQQDTSRELESYRALLTTGCHRDLRMLLCGVYLPFCPENVNKMVITCRPICERVKRSCLRYLTRFNYKWPDSLNCSRMYQKNTVDHMCIDGPGSNVGATARPVPPVTRHQTKTTVAVTTVPRTKASRTSSVNIVSTKHVAKIRSTRTYCRVLYARNEANYFYVEKIRACALGCSKDGIFTYAQKQTMEKWITGLAYMCALLSISALLVILFNFKVANFPERAIIFITICYLLYSVAFIVRIVLGREGVSCEKENGRQYLLVDGSGNISCATTFLFAYCFSMAQSIWWVILTLAWFLRAGLRWKVERVNAKAPYFHFFAWAVPCAKTVVVLVLRRIDASELSGVCFVGNRFENLQSLRGFVLGPLFTYLIMGCIFLICGFVGRYAAVFPASHDTCQDQNLVKLDSRLLPTGIFAALHTFFSTYILASYFYEYVNKETWYLDPAASGPNFTVFLLRTIMDFAIGISASIWLLLRYVPLFFFRLRERLHEPVDELTGPQLEPLHRFHEPCTGRDSGGGGTNETSI